MSWTLPPLDDGRVPTWAVEEEPPPERRCEDCGKMTLFVGSKYCFGCFRDDHPGAEVVDDDTPKQNEAQAPVPKKQRAAASSSE